MRVLWCLDGTNVEALSKTTEMLLATQSLTIGMIYVIDTGPRKDIEHTRERFFAATPSRQGHASMKCSRQSRQPQRIF
jgi:hypothetical protein